MKHVCAIVLAAGRSLRFSRLNTFAARGGIPTHIRKMIESGKSKISKVLAKIDSKPIIIYSLDILSKHPAVGDIIVVANEKNSKEITDRIIQYRIRKVRRIVKGGRRRQDSVINGLYALNKNTDLVLIHDAARPFIEKKIVSGLIKQAGRHGAAIAGVPIKATVKKLVARSSQLIVEKTIDRNNLCEIQTPQVFKKDLILEAYKRFGHLSVTDDSMLVEKLGVKVRVVLGSYDNIKITTPEDLVIAEAILKAKSVKRKA